MVMILAAGTIAYHLALAFELQRAVLAAMWVVLTFAGIVLVRRIPIHPTFAEDLLPDPLGAIMAAGLAATAAAALYLVPESVRWWSLYWPSTVAALLLSLRTILRGKLRPRLASRVATRPTAAVVVLFLAAAMAVASLVTTRPDLDDVYVVNRSVYVENHGGEIPKQDVLFADQEHAGQRLPLRSPAFEVLLGVVAALVPFDTATVVYLWLAPLASMLSILAIWSLVRKLRCSRPLVAVAAATLFLLLDGSRHGSFGNFSFARMWQGKVVLCAVLVPLIWGYAVGWGRDGSRRDLVLLAAANAAAAGLSSSGYFVAPLATGVISVGLAVGVRLPKRLLGAGVATAYPVALALLNRATDTRLDATTTDAASTLEPWSRWTFVFGRPTLALSAIAVALGWLAARDRISRTGLAIAALLVMLTLYGPRLLDPLRVLSPGASPILWRTIWVLPVPALIGMLATVPWSFGTRPRTAVVSVTAVVAVAFGLFVGTTTPVMSSRNHASVGWPGWKTGGNTQVAERLVREATAGSVVAGPFEVDRVVPLLASDVRAVDPRPGWYVGGVDPEPRTLVQHALTTGIAEQAAGKLGDALDELSVDAVALPTRLRADPVRSVLERQAFVLRGIEGQYLIFTRLTTSERGHVS